MKLSLWKETVQKTSKFLCEKVTLLKKKKIKDERALTSEEQVLLKNIQQDFRIYIFRDAWKNKTKFE